MQSQSMLDSRLLFLLFSLLFVGRRICRRDCRRCRSFLPCRVSGCIGEKCFPLCADGAEYEQESLFVKLERRLWDCLEECRHHCMLSREVERLRLGLGPLNYHGKWPFRRIYVIQEPVSVALSVLNLVVHFFGLLSFYNLVYKKLPLRPDGRTYYEHTILWLVYGILSMSSWFWSAVFHSRDVNITEKLDYSFAVGLLGFSLILAILRTFNVTDEAARVMLSAPIIAFVTTHILYLNFYQLDYGKWIFSAITLIPQSDKLFNGFTWPQWSFILSMVLACMRWLCTPKK